jgi:hypothetical protein
MTSNYNPHYDIRPAKLSFIDDLRVGEQAEDAFVDFLQLLASGDVEIKYDRYRNGRMFVETDQMPRGAGIWVKSGINITKAKWWVYYLSPSAFLVVAVERLKNYLRVNYAQLQFKGKVKAGTADNPAQGYLLYADQVHDLLTNERYDIIND